MIGSMNIRLGVVPVEVLKSYSMRLINVTIRIDRLLDTICICRQVNLIDLVI
jgi:hypothetical protein